MTKYAVFGFRHLNSVRHSPFRLLALLQRKTSLRVSARVEASVSSRAKRGTSQCGPVTELEGFFATLRMTSLFVCATPQIISASRPGEHAKSCEHWMVQSSHFVIPPCLCKAASTSASRFECELKLVRHTKRERGTSPNWATPSAFVRSFAALRMTWLFVFSTRRALRLRVRL